MYRPFWSLWDQVVLASMQVARRIEGVFPWRPDMDSEQPHVVGVAVTILGVLLRSDWWLYEALSGFITRKTVHSLGPGARGDMAET